MRPSSGGAAPAAPPVRPAAASAPAHLERRDEVRLGEFGRAHGQRLKRREPSLERAVVDLVWVELFVDVGRQPHGPDTLDVTRTGAEGDPIEDVCNCG